MQNYRKVGILTLVALVALGLIVMWKSDFLLKQGGYQMIGSFQDIQGLTVGSEVRYRGVKAGKVMRIDPGMDDIRVYSLVNRDIRIPDQSFLRVAFDGLVGMKYLEVIPVHSAGIYKPSQVLSGEATSGIVDFVDIGAQNLEETKRILEVIRTIIERPDIQAAFIDAVLTTQKATNQINELTMELRKIAQSIDSIVSDPKFQASVKSVAGQTDKTLSSANDFFGSFAQLRIVPSGNVQFGTINNEIRANLDVVPSKNRHDYYRFGLGEGPATTQGLSLQDLWIARQVSSQFGMRIGMINASLGGGVEFYPNDLTTLAADLYKINNNPDYPKLRFTAEQQIEEYLDVVIRADNCLNYDKNYSVGLTVK
ncbi:MAG: MlaD family protein, partial [Candidatus Margulisiibacteriota bacterium]